MNAITMPAESIMTLTRSDLTSILRLSGTRKTGAITITPRKVFEYDADGCLRQERKTPCAVQGTMTLPLNFARLFVRLMDAAADKITFERIDDKRVKASYHSFQAALFCGVTPHEEREHAAYYYDRVSMEAYVNLDGRFVRVTPLSVSADNETFQAQPLTRTARGVTLLTSHAPITYRFVDGLPVDAAAGVKISPAYKRRAPELQA